MNAIATYAAGDRRRTADTAAWHTKLLRSERGAYAIYVLALAAAGVLWLRAIQAPLWQDETGSYWQISAGVSQIWARQFMPPTSPAYLYILWFFTKVMGSSEIALRIPSVLAMAGAACLLYRAARELFARDISLIATVIFCLNPIVVFESVDVRPYAFAVLLTNAAILVLLRLRRSESGWLAAMFGLLAAGILYFHHLFGAILPAFLVCLIAFKIRNGRTGRKQLGIALGVFSLAFLPLIPGLDYLFRTAHSHVCEAAPEASQLFWTFAADWLLPSFVLVILISAVNAGFWEHGPIRSWKTLICVSTGLIPVLLLFGISAGTSIHLFAERYRLAAMPGLALCWALVLTRIRWHMAKPLFIAVFGFLTVGTGLVSANAGKHKPSWKAALAAAQENTSIDHAPIVLCSGFVESDHSVMPVNSPRDSFLFAPLSYYKVSAPVIPLPLDLNAETIRVASDFLRTATPKNQRFLIAVEKKSHPTIEWFEQNASEAYTDRALGKFDGVEVVEFVPRKNVALGSH